jgi:hypothetical protein
MIFLVTCFVLFCMSCSLQPAQQKPLSLSIESDTVTILRYEPLPLKLILRNTSGQGVESTIGLHRLNVETSLMVAYEKGAYIKWKRSWQPDLQAPPLRKERMSPGQSVSYPIVIFWQEAVPIFDKPGKYKVKASWQGTVGTVESSPYEVTVVDGTSADKSCLDQLVARGLQGFLSPESIDLIPKSGDARLSILQGLHNTTQQCRDSRYVVHLLSTLLNIIGSESVDAPYKTEVLVAAEDQIIRNPHPRTLYFYAKLIAGEKPELARQYLKQAETLKPDVVIAEMIRESLEKLK